MVRGEPEAESEVHVPLRAGPVAELVVRLERTRVRPGASEPVDVFIIGRDAEGNPAPATAVEVYVDGQRARGRPLADGRVVTQLWPAKPARGAAGKLVIEAVLPGAYRREEIALAAGPVPVVRPVLADPDRSLTPWLGVLVARGNSLGIALGLDASARTRWLPRRLEAGLSLGYLGRRLRVDDGQGFSEVALDQGLLLGMLRWRWRARPRLDVIPVGGVGLSLVRGRSRQFGHSLVGWGWTPAVTAGAELGARLAGGSATLTGRYLHVPLGRMSNADRYAGNGGGVVIELGYRVGL